MCFEWEVDLRVLQDDSSQAYFTLVIILPYGITCTGDVARLRTLYCSFVLFFGGSYLIPVSYLPCTDFETLSPQQSKRKAPSPTTPTSGKKNVAALSASTPASAQGSSRGDKSGEAKKQLAKSGLEKAASSGVSGLNIRDVSGFVSSDRAFKTAIEKKQHAVSRPIYYPHGGSWNRNAEVPWLHTRAFVFPHFFLISALQAFAPSHFLEGSEVALGVRHKTRAVN